MALLTQEDEGSSEIIVPSLDTISINYNSVDWSYLNTYEEFNVIQVEMVTPDEEPTGTMAANTGLDYDEVKNELIVVQTPNLPTLRYDRDIVLSETMADLSSQGIDYDASNDRYYELGTDGINARNKDGDLLFVLAFPATQPSPGKLYYSSLLDLFLVTYDLTDFIYAWKPNFDNNTLSLFKSISVIGAQEGVTMDERNQVIWVNCLEEKRKVTLNGGTIFSFPFDLNNTGVHNEGLAFDPTDGTLWFNSDEYFHGGITGGNRLWHIDPEKKYNKNISIPDQIKWEWGQLSNAQIVNNILERIDTNAPGYWISPVFDMNNYSDLQLSEKYSVAPVKILTSSTAPTSTPYTIFPYDYYYDWGSTVPSEADLSGILRYVQFKFEF